MFRTSLNFSKEKSLPRRKRSVSEISIMQLRARREARRTKSKWTTRRNTTTVKTVNTVNTKRTFSTVPIRLGLLEENKRQRMYVLALLITLFIQTIAIFWNMFALWNPDEPKVWNDNIQTTMAKCLITFTCIVMTWIVILIRLIDLKQLPNGSARRRYNSFIALESFFLMIHVPPVKFGMFGPDDDV